MIREQPLQPGLLRAAGFFDIATQASQRHAKQPHTDHTENSAVQGPKNRRRKGLFKHAEDQQAYPAKPGAVAGH